MKYPKLIFLSGTTILCAVFCGCSKKTSLPPKVPFVYGVSGFSDFTVSQYIDSLLHLKLRISYVSGITDSVRLAPAVVPNGVLFLTDPETGLPDFSWIFTIKVHIDTPGTFPVSMRATSPSGDTQYHSFNIIATPDSNCAIPMAGIYTDNTTCSSGIPFGGTASNIRVTSNGIDLLSGGNYPTLEVKVNCHTGNLTTSSYSDDDISVLPGTGTFTPNTIKYNYEVREHTGLFSGTCTTILTR